MVARSTMGEGSGGPGTPRSPGTAGSLRNTPPAISTRWIERPQLLARLDRRFELDATVLVAPAGYGKTTLLAQAVAAAAADPGRLDLWLQCSPDDQDPEVLAAGLLGAAGLARPALGWQPQVEVVADALLRFAPQPVCLVIDDLHLVPPGSPGMALLDRLVSRLPHNVHLVLAGRTPPPLRLARRQAGGAVEHLVAADLAFDEDEALRVFGSRAADGLAPTDWPVLANLMGDTSGDAAVTYLLEEVVSTLDGTSLAAIAALVDLRQVTDELVHAATGGWTSAEQFLAGLPLVHRSPDGTFQLHDLWRAALKRLPDPDLDTSAAVERVAEVLEEQERFVEAAELYERVEDLSGLEAVLERFAARPLTFADPVQLRRLAAVAGANLPESPVGAILEATLHHLRNESSTTVTFEDAARRARSAARPSVEALALRNVLNMRNALFDEEPAWAAQRITDLAHAGDPVGRSLYAVLCASRARRAGEPEQAAAHLRRLSPQTSAMEAVQFAFGMSDLGRPEEVAGPDGALSETDVLRRAGGQYLAQAIWLRGDISPELALATGRHMSQATEGRRIAHLQVSTNSVLTLVALAAGEVTTARSHATAALGWAVQTPPGPVRSFARMADALTVVCERGETDGALALAHVVDELPIGCWPPRPYLYALPTLYLLCPALRPTLDECRFGAAISAARDAGAALVALRDHDDVEPAAALPWNRPNLLRAHILPVHLVELGAAVASVGHPDVGEVLDSIPGVRCHLVSVSEARHQGASWARDRLVVLPPRPDYDLEVGVLGATTLARGGTPVTDAAWVRRERVRQLLALVLLHDRISRTAVAAMLWPDHDPAKALANLRVNLSHLHKVLQPQRSPDAEPWFVRSTTDLLEVASDGIELDAARFERLCTEGRELDHSGRGSEALTAYREAASLYRGDYLAEWPDLEWASVERVRLRSLATSAASRLGELLIARGEPEEAASWAAEALRQEPLHERAHRVLVRALLGQDDRAGAVRTTRELIEMLAGEGLRPDAETVKLASSIGLDVGGVP
ncbi:MAG: hypothetical protein JJU45_17570 [Acidimicrobiia bacterium]|nr:hypothetical protein [Acidimicrobiia bacterium]